MNVTHWAVVFVQTHFVGRIRAVILAGPAYAQGKARLFRHLLGPIPTPRSSLYGCGEAAAHGQGQEAYEKTWPPASTARSPISRQVRTPDGPVRNLAQASRSDFSGPTRPYHHHPRSSSPIRWLRSTRPNAEILKLVSSQFCFLAWHSFGRY